MRRLSLNQLVAGQKSGQNIPKNRCRTTIPDRIVETPAELPFIGDQVVCLSHNQAVRSGPASMSLRSGRELAENMLASLGLEYLVNHPG